MEIIKNDVGMTLEKHSENSKLYHLTNKNVAEQIASNGIYPSSAGDIVINGNDGAGIYAIRDMNDMDYVMSLAGWLIGIEDTVVVEFDTSSDWYVCVNELLDEDDIDSEAEDDECIDPELLPHYGYVVHPGPVAPSYITSVKPLLTILQECNIQYP